jgi:hypothetical protein
MRFTFVFVQSLAFLDLSLGLQKSSPNKCLRCASPQHRHGQQPRHLSKAFLMMNYEDGEEDELDFAEFTRRIPETAFGSEAVPEGQRPINEYLDLQRAPLFGWATLNNTGLFFRLLLVYAVVFSVVCYPIAGATFTSEGYTLQKVASANVGALSLVMLLLLRFFSGWGYVGQRLTSSIVEYEETGWYDGDFERKTKSKCHKANTLSDNDDKLLCMFYCSHFLFYHSFYYKLLI